MDDFPINCTGDVVVGDTIRFTEKVFSGSFRNPKYEGNRTITAQVVADSYGIAKQQHTFTLMVINCASDGNAPCVLGRTTRKGRNIYRNGCARQAWPDESSRRAIAAEKHQRGDAARAARAERVAGDA